LKISELKSGMSNVALTAKVAKMTEPKQIMTKFGTQVTLVNATLEDDSGSIPMALWGEQHNGLEEGASVEITGGFTKEFRDELQLGLGRGGKIKSV